MSNRYYSKDQDIRFRMTTPAEEKELFIKAKAGDEVAREFLIRNHLLFAKTQAESMVTGDLPNDEIVSAANWAVMKAYEQFQPEKGFRFTTYLRFWIKKGIRLLWESKFSGNGLIDPSASSGSHDINKLRCVNLDMFVCGKERFEKGYDPVLGVPDESPTVEEIDLTKFNQTCLAKALSKLGKKDAELIRLRYVEGWTFTRIGKKRGVSRQAVKEKHTQIMTVLKRRLMNQGVTTP